MAKINLPKEMLKEEAFKLLSAKDKEEYVSNLLNRVLQLNPNGVTISQIKEAAGLNYSTIWHHLEVLSRIAQCHKVSRGNLDIYYPAGNFNHLNEHAKDKVLYSISTLKNENEDFVCIHEKRENRAGNHVVCSGVCIPVELIGNFIADLSRIKSLNLNKKQAKK